MKRLLGLVLIGLGVMLVALAVALPNYVYPRVAKVPANPEQELVAEGDDITVLVPSLVVQGKEARLRNQRAVAVRRVTGQVPPNGQALPAGQQFYRTAFEARVDNPDLTPRESLMQAYVEGGSFDGFTGEATNCCGDYLQKTQDEDPDTPVRHEGLQFKFPFDVQKQDYPFWDANIRSAPAARYDGEEKIMGLATYRFVQRIDDQVIGPQVVPGRLFGRSEPSVDAERIYATTRTMWVEPHTGVVVKGQEQQNQRLRYEGQFLPVFQGLMTLNDETVQATVDEFAGSARSLGFVTTAGPIGGWVLGLGSVLAGLLLFRSSRRADGAGDWDDDWDEWDDAPHEETPVAGRRAYAR